MLAEYVLVLISHAPEVVEFVMLLLMLPQVCLHGDSVSYLYFSVFNFNIL